MSKCLRCGAGPEWLQGKIPNEQSEIDEWHPASKPSKPEDFEPTGFIQYRSSIGSYHHCDSDEFKALLNHDVPITHWRKITPPVPIDNNDSTVSVKP
jgi:hypothetical protein